MIKLRGDDLFHQRDQVEYKYLSGTNVETDKGLFRYKLNHLT